MRDLSKGLIAGGYSVRVMTSRHGHARGDGLAFKDEVEGVSVIRVFSRGGGKVRSVLFLLAGLLHLTLHGRGGVYHAMDVGAVGWLAVIAGNLLDGCSVVKLRSGPSGYRTRYRSAIQKWQFVALLRLVDRVQVVNQELEKFAGDLGIPSRKIVRIPNAVDTRIFHQTSSDEKAVIRRGLGISNHKTIVTYVGRLEHIKGVDVLVRAWRELPATLRNESLLMVVGDGSCSSDIVELVNSLGLRDSIRMIGEQQLVQQYYAAADIFVLPSRSEGAPVALIEAMACGLPVIASNVGAISELVDEDENGLMFESEQHSQLAERLAYLLRMRCRWTEMGALARRTVKDRADLEKIVYRVQDMYLQLAWRS